MAEDGKEVALEVAEKEIVNIVRQRSATYFEKRVRTLTQEISRTQDEFRIGGALRSGAYVKRELELRRDAVRDNVFARFNIAREIRSKYGLAWNEDSLNAILEDLQRLIEGQFSALRKVMQDSGRTWVLEACDRERDILKAEVKREIQALRSEIRIQKITADRKPDESRPIHINISGGQIGVLNIAGIIDTIEQNLSVVTERGGKETAEAIKYLTEAVVASGELKEDQAKQALEQLEFLSSQVVLPAEKRSKAGVVVSIFSALRGLFSLASDLSQVWSTWGPRLEAALRSIGMI